MIAVLFEAKAAPAQNVFHQAAQAEGRASIFSFYRIRVAQLVREYSSETGGHAACLS